MKKEIEIKSDEFWVKIVDFLQQNWALIEQKEGKFSVSFVNDGSGVFDKLEFDNEQEAINGLVRNGFKKYSDPIEDFTQFIKPPARPFFESPKIIYSNGLYWK